MQVVEGVTIEVAATAATVTVADGIVTTLVVGPHVVILPDTHATKAATRAVETDMGARLMTAAAMIRRREANITLNREKGRTEIEIRTATAIGTRTATATETKPVTETVSATRTETKIAIGYNIALPRPRRLEAEVATRDPVAGKMIREEKAVMTGRDTSVIGGTRRMRRDIATTMRQATLTKNECAL